MWKMLLEVHSLLDKESKNDIKNRIYLNSTKAARRWGLLSENVDYKIKWIKCLQPSILGDSFICEYCNKRRFPGGSVINNLPAKTRDVLLIPRLEDPLEKELSTHSSILI